MTDTPSLVKATLLSLVVAVLVLVIVVLPAEFDIDPLGTGELLGLTGLSRTGPSAVTTEVETFSSDRIRFELAPFESVEYKYRIEQGGGVVFSWQASGEVIFDLHAEPDGAEPGYAESFAQGRGTTGNGTYMAALPGIHGWFWENRGVDTVEVDLVTSGFYDHAIEFRDGDQSRVQPASARDAISP
jgi:hypothetical protein